MVKSPQTFSIMSFLLTFFLLFLIDTIFTFSFLSCLLHFLSETNFLAEIKFKSARGRTFSAKLYYNSRNINCFYPFVSCCLSHTVLKVQLSLAVTGNF